MANTCINRIKFGVEDNDKKLFKEVLDYLKENGLDGLPITFVYPYHFDSFDVENEDGICFSINFDCFEFIVESDWVPPEEHLENLTRKFKNIWMNVSYEESGMDNYGWLIYRKNSGWREF
jgi:hypothetical protein